VSEEESLHGGQEDPDEAGHSLLYPFVCCASNGGPYDDAAFVAGVRFGHIDAVLQAGPAIHETTVEEALLPQLDLLAMHRGYSTEHEDTEVGDWHAVTLRKLKP
jgi:hypothetical protein